MKKQSSIYINLKFTQFNQILYNNYSSEKYANLFYVGVCIF